MTNNLKINRVIENGRIVGTSLGYEEHGIFTYSLHLEFANGGQSFGNYRLRGQYTNLHIEGILKALNVNAWEDLIGQQIRIDHEPFGNIYAIGHYLKDQWFIPEKIKEEEKEHA